MNLENEIARLLKRSKTLSTIRFLPYTSNLPSRIVEFNVALRSAETEEVRWNLFLELLRVWLHQRSPALGRMSFGSIALWHSPKPPPIVVGVDRKGFSLYQDMLIVAEVIGDSTLIDRYSTLVKKEKLAITLAEYNRKSRVL